MADHRAAEEAAGGEGHARRRGEARREAAEQGVVHDRDGHDREHARRDQALVEGAHDRLIGAEPHREGADDRGDDAGRADGEGVEHHRFEDRGVAGEEDRREHQGGDDRDGVGLEQVGGHAGAVADIVADVVGDGGGVARIILRDARLDLADEVAADIGALGEDAAAEAGEDRDQRGAEAERHQGVDDLAARRGEAGAAGEVGVVEGDAEERQARHQHAGDGARLERDLQAAAERGRGRLRGADVGAHGHVHTDEAGHA